MQYPYPPCPPRPIERPKNKIFGFCLQLFQIIGIALMVIGFLLVMFFVPIWVWPAIFGAVMIAVGFILWKFVP